MCFQELLEGLIPVKKRQIWNRFKIESFVDAEAHIKKDNPLFLKNYVQSRTNAAHVRPFSL